MKSFASSKEITDKTKNGENVQNLKLVQADSMQYNLSNNQYQEKFRALYAFTR